MILTFPATFGILEITCIARAGAIAPLSGAVATVAVLRPTSQCQFLCTGNGLLELREEGREEYGDGPLEILVSRHR